ncbi:hypothetical protein BGHDH14_bgh05201 [Blumeria hordei DH14]|uniref:Uncharacterized protein n=1 Tax=Blumeria graminis f. sp. hordei (strain DH14) TaxID=546991 RepID=N1JL32_BLUG1|nr:hypothetical protein BGHDH14_bgh05201 [Blumeria hordei DH14]
MLEMSRLMRFGAVARDGAALDAFAETAVLTRLTKSAKRKGYGRLWGSSGSIPVFGKLAFQVTDYAGQDYSFKQISLDDDPRSILDND